MNNKIRKITNISLMLFLLIILFNGCISQVHSQSNSEFYTGTIIDVQKNQKGNFYEIKIKKDIGGVCIAAVKEDKFSIGDRVKIEISPTVMKLIKL
jgi:hypothetical protein